MYIFDLHDHAVVLKFKRLFNKKAGFRRIPALRMYTMSEDILLFNNNQAARKKTDTRHLQ